MYVYISYSFSLYSTHLSYGAHNGSRTLCNLYTRVRFESIFNELAQLQMLMGFGTEAILTEHARFAVKCIFIEVIASGYL